MDDLKHQIRDIDDLINEKDQKFVELDDTLKGKEGEQQDLEDIIASKDKMIM